MAQKSILEQALLQVQTLEEAVKANAKGILASTMKQELNDLLKEQEDEKDPEEVEKDVDGITPDDEETSDNEPVDNGNEDLPLPVDDENDTEEDSGLDLPAEDEEDDEVLDMTDASEEEVLKVFKAMKPEDGIIVKREGDTVSLEDDGNEYIIKLDDVADEDEDEFPERDELPDELAEQEEPADEEIVYEIELDDEDEEAKECETKEEVSLSDGKPFDKKAKKTETKESVTVHRTHTQKDGQPFDKSSPQTGVKKLEAKEQEKAECTECGDKFMKEVEATEAARTKWNAHGNRAEEPRTGIKSKHVHHAGSRTTMEEQINVLKKQNNEYKKALVLFKDKLNEVAVFNASLAYATRLFTEHSTTKQEKLDILKRFDSVSTITESKNLYATIKGELENTKPITETAAEKITSTPKSSATEMLSESKAYENPQFKRMKELIKKIQ